MNFSRYTYFEALYNRILQFNKRQFKKKRYEIIREIDFQINIITKKAQDGYWGICGGDKTFIHFLEKLKAEVQQKQPDIRSLFSEVSELAEKKIKVVFFTQETSVWPSLQPVYDACVTDGRYTTKLVYIPFHHINSDLSEDYIVKYQNMGLPIISHTEYYLKDDNPDIAFFVKPYDLIPAPFYIDEVNKVVRRCIYIPYGMEIGNSKESIRFQYKLMLHYKAWKVLCYSEQYYERAVIYGYRNGKNYLKIGHPRFDLINKNLQNDKIAMDIKNRANGRKIFLWNTHFTLDNDSSWGSFMIWGSFILDYVKAHGDIFLIWRPHPLFFQALKDVEGMNEEKVGAFLDTLSENENIYIDKSEDYLTAFYVSHAMISDASSFVPEYLAWGKPILYTPKLSGQGFYDKGIYELLYIVNTQNDIFNFFNQIKNDIDEKKSFRLREVGNHLLLHNKGVVGRKLIDYIADEIVLEERNAVQ